MPVKNINLIYLSTPKALYHKAVSHLLIEKD